jgi:hypothetical protein
MMIKSFRNNSIIKLLAVYLLIFLGFSAFIWIENLLFTPEMTATGRFYYSLAMGVVLSVFCVLMFELSKTKANKFLKKYKIIIWIVSFIVTSITFTSIFSVINVDEASQNFITDAILKMFLLFFVLI